MGSILESKKSLRTPTKPESQKINIFEAVNEYVRDNGGLGLLEKMGSLVKKYLFTFWYRLRLKVGKKSFFTGRVNIQGAKYIDVGNYCVIEEGASLNVSRNGNIIIKDHCFIGKDAQLISEGKLEVLEGTYILKGAEIAAVRNIQLGPKAWIAKDCKIGGFNITLEKNVILGPCVSIVGGDHPYDRAAGQVLMSSDGENQAHRAPVVLKEGCWIGTRSVILKGVVIGKGSIVGAGAVVTKEVLPRHLYAGIPAIKIKSLS